MSSRLRAHPERPATPVAGGGFAPGESERLLRLIFDTEPECVKLVGPDGRLLAMNPAGLAMLEVGTLAEAQGIPLMDFISPAHRTAFMALHQKVMQGGEGSLEFEVIGRRGTRRWLDTRAVPLRDEGGAITGLLGVTRDVSERRVQQVRIERLSRMRRVMGSINALIVRTRKRTELFQEACRVAVEEGGFGLAWIGVIEEGDTVVPVAMHGRDGGHLAKLRFSVTRDDPGACSVSLRALRSGKPGTCNEVATDQTLGPWREPLLVLGYHSLVSQPLLVGGRVTGCMNLYSTEPRFFDADEMVLLAELARDLSYALEYILKDEALDNLAVYDPLTRLPNRTLFVKRLREYINIAQESAHRLAVVMLDVERFKAINDLAGQAGGDDLLKLAGQRLKFHAGDSSRVARIAGDRFAIVIPDLPTDLDVEAYVRDGGWDRLDPPFQHGGQEFEVTFRVGLAVYPQDGADADAVLRNAELALKHGKVTGTRCTRYAADMGDVARRKFDLDRKLRRALAHDELALHYQPKVDLRTGKVCGAEALLRWNSPDQGVVMPALMIPLMEETGLIREVGQWALSRAVAQRELWRREGLDPPRVGVNVSAVQLREKNFFEQVRTTLRWTPGAAEGLELEVTESLMMSDPDANVHMLRSLRELGLSIAMDDFGTGYSSLAYLARLPLNSVKIDRSFVAGMGDHAEMNSIVSSIIALAHSMHLRVVAEGVETQEQLRDLRLLRCDELQGYLFSAALPPEAFAALLREGRKLS